MTPNKERLTLWRDALLSLPRIEGQLKKGDCFCVLGAAYEVYRRETGTGTWRLERGSSRIEEFIIPSAQAEGGISCSCSFLEQPVADWYGIEQNLRFRVSTSLYPPNTEISLYRLNDMLHYSFPQLAQLLTERYELEPFNE